MSTNILVKLHGCDDFKFTVGRTAGAVEKKIRSAALLQGGALKQDGLTFMDDDVLSAGEYQFIGGISTAQAATASSKVAGQNGQSPLDAGYSHDILSSAFWHMIRLNLMGREGSQLSSSSFRKDSTKGGSNMQPQDSSTQPLFGSEKSGQNSMTVSPQSSPEVTPTKTMETRKMAKKVFLEPKAKLELPKEASMAKKVFLESKAKFEFRNLPKEASKDAQSPESETESLLHGRGYLRHRKTNVIRNS